MSKYDYTKLKELLEKQESFPHTYTHKFIGRNTPVFTASVERFEKRFPALKPQSTRLSSGDGHRSVTYTGVVSSADEIIAIMRATEEIEDVLVML